MSFSGKVLVYGGKGALGSSIVKFFKEKNWWIICLDLKENEDAHCSLIVTPNDNWSEQNKKIQADVSKTLQSNKLDALICVAGGWVGGNAASKEFVENCNSVWKQSVWSSVIASSLSCNHLKPGGLLVLTGAQAAVEGTPEMIGYGMAKAAVHHLVKSLRDPKGGLPPNTTVTALLPAILDTPINRKFMPKSNFANWTPLETISSKIYNWASNKEKPTNGSLMQLITKEGETQFLAV